MTPEPTSRISRIGDLLFYPSAAALIVSNALPLAGVLLWGWDLFFMLFIYWLESAVIGFFNVLRMQITGREVKYQAIGFFIMHYGIFMGVHLAFLTSFFGPRPPPSFAGDRLAFAVDRIFPEAWLPVFVLWASHGFSFIYNFLWLKEYEHASALGRKPPEITFNGRKTDDPAAEYLFKPYGRIVVMHLTVLAGGFLTQRAGAPVAALVLLVVLKTAIDLFGHLIEHGRIRPGGNVRLSAG